MNIYKSVATDEDLKKINQFSSKELTAKDIYTFKVNLCNNDIDRDNEKFSINALHKLADLFVGKTGIFDHSFKASDQKSRIYDTEIIKVDNKFTADGEPFYNLQAKAYMLNNDENKALIEEIDSGIKKEVSISCSVSKRICSICGNDSRKNHCEHRAGEIYDNQNCYYVLDDVSDAYEFSFVAVPAQREAGVTKSFKSLEEKIKEGREFKTSNLNKWIVTKSKDGKHFAEGYATVFNTPYLLYSDETFELYEIVKDYAFDSCDLSDVIMQYNHQGRVFARKRNSTLDVLVDNYGLKIKADLSQTQLGREIAEEIEKGFSDEMSYGYLVGKTEQIFEQNKATGRKKIVRIIHEVKKVYDVSVVSIPANNAATISMRSKYDGLIEFGKQELLKQEIKKQQALAEIEIIAKRNKKGI